MTCPACNLTESITVGDGHAKCPCGARWELDQAEVVSE